MRYQHAGLLVFLTLAASGSSQTFRGAINGSVTDPTEGVVPKAEVVVENIATGIKHTTFTTPEGQFVFHSSYRQASAPKPRQIVRSVLRTVSTRKPITEIAIVIRSTTSPPFLATVV